MQKLKFSKAPVEPPRIIIYGEHGIGKSSIAKGMTSPVVIPTERGLSAIPVDATPIPATWAEFKSILAAIKTQDHDYRTLVIDVLNNLEPLIHKHVAEANNVSDIGAIKWGQGWSLASAQWRWLTKQLDIITEERKMVVILLAHARITKVDLPDSDPYESFHMDLLREVDRNWLCRWCDMCLFYRYKTKIERIDGGFGAVKTKAIGDGERALYSQKRPAFFAKNRYDGVPFEIDVALDEPETIWPMLKDYIKGTHEKAES